MGYYIDPKDMSKEAFLSKHGTFISGAPKNFDFSGATLPVCWVDNGPFTAAGICPHQGEVDAFAYPDARHKRWFEVPKEALKPFYP
jgi:hypothetical protein